jgi:hypothetical protein
MHGCKKKVSISKRFDFKERKKEKKFSQKKVKFFGKIHCRVDFEKETISFPRLAVHKRDD